MTREDVKHDLQVLIEYFNDKAGATPICLEYCFDMLEQEPCTDAVSRQWLICKATERFYTTNYFNHITKMIEEAPSVNPQKSGKCEVKEDKEEQLKKLKAELDYAKFRCTL